MFYVYCLISDKNPKFHYYGYTSNIQARVKEHKRGKCRTTRRFLPVRLLGYRRFDTEEEARQFEKDLKSKASYRRRFILELQEVAKQVHRA